MSNDFSKETILKAFIRQGGRCAYSGRKLVGSKRGDNSAIGGWESHHRKPTSQGGSNALRNCVLFSVYPVNCHFDIGHGGVSWDNYEPLRDYELPYLYYGSRPVKKAVKNRAKPHKTRQVRTETTLTRIGKSGKRS